MRSVQASGRGARGQILVVFVLSLIAIFAMVALLFDGANALVTKRKLQNASDAAALAAANLIQTGNPKGCSATAGPPPGSPRTQLVTAAQDAVRNSLPNFPTASISVTCPDGWSNYAVQVSLAQTSGTFFGGAIGIRGIDVGTSSQAVNGQVATNRFSVIELDPYNPSWPNNRQGCPSMLISGGPTLTFEGSVQVDSSCPSGHPAGGALATNGNSATITMNNGATFNVVGGYQQGSLTVSPIPNTGAPYVKDPLAKLPPMPVSSLPIRANPKLILGAGDVVLEPGVYVGGIQLKNSVKAFLRPGIYVMQGGGFDIGAQNAVYSVAATVSSTTDANWAADCPTASCGVLLYNTGLISGGLGMGQISVGAGATLRLRPYVPSADLTGAYVNDYEDLLIWQDASPAASSSYAQPVVALNGGGTVSLSGTLYAPQGAITMGGGSGGSGGSATTLTLQFISWDISFQGNSAFHFDYVAETFAKPTDYGLIQ
jgi:Flp pilus assembly protein TadG